MDKVLKAIISFGSRWVEQPFKRDGVSYVRFWLDKSDNESDISDKDIDVLAPFEGMSVTLPDTDGTYIVTLKRAGTMYENKYGQQVPRKSHSVELRPNLRKYVSFASK